jgi:hypothetical protein
MNKSCSVCNNIFEDKTKSKNKKYCSLTCRNLRSYNTNGYITKDADNKKEQYLKNKDYYYKKTYNITLNDYNEMFVNQGGCCAICNIHQRDLGKGLAVDHCHKTGAVRKLLCHHCNTALGNFRDNKDYLQKAIDYLAEHE